VDVTANPKVAVRVVIDDLTGDEIKGRGNGTLNIHSGTNEPLTMRGRFDIVEGDYLFTFQSFFKKPFKLRKGADNNISWDRDPYAAKINVEAVYTAERVSFAPLAMANYVAQSYARQREDVDVVVNLTGELFKPNFKFRLDFPPNSITKSDFSVAANIQRIENNENDINRQVTYLIVFNSFAPAENTQGANQSLGSAFGEFANSTISSLSGLFFNEINKKLNSELSKILKTDNVTVNFSGYIYNRNFLSNQTNNGIGFNQGNFNVNVPISLFKDRFVVTLGSTLDVPLQSTIQQNVQFLPDVTAEWLINQSGTIRASFFYRQDLDYLTTSSTGAARNKRSGASIAYRREFDTSGEFITEFFGKKRKKKQPLQPPPPATTDSLQRTTAVPPVQPN
jgi:TamB, inner membrane protein subunit of TAM complex